MKVGLNLSKIFLSGEWVFLLELLANRSDMDFFFERV